MKEQQQQKKSFGMAFGKAWVTDTLGRMQEMS